MMRDFNLRNKESISWDDAKQYIKNIYNKVRNKVPIETHEQQLLEGMPKEVIDEVNQEEQVPIDVTDQVRVIEEEDKEKLLEESPEAQILNSFMPEIFDNNIFFAESEPRHIDASINTLAYFRAFGYISGMWGLGPEHNASPDHIEQLNEQKKQQGIPGRSIRQQDLCRPMPYGLGDIPVCERLDTSEIELEYAIQNAIAHAHEKGYYPPKPIIALAHPGCSCNILCWAPVSPENIPDTAPGVPTFGTDEEKLYYKGQIHANLADFYVDRWTVLSDAIYEQTPGEGAGFSEYDVVQATYQHERYKIAEEEWIEDIKPIIVKDGFVYKNYLGIIRPVPKTYNGLQVERSSTHAKIYLGEMARTLVVPLEKIEEISIKPTKFFNINSNMYIKVADTIGIVIKVFSEDKILCYLPEFDSRTFVDSGTIYEIG